MFHRKSFSLKSFSEQSWRMTAAVDEPEDDDEPSPFSAHRRSWRPLPVEQLPPPKRKRKRRQADILLLGH